MKRSEIKPCAVCGKGVMHDNQILFLSLKISRLGMNIRAIEQQHGLELMLGSPTLAQVMGPDKDLAIEIVSVEILLCDTCASKSVNEVFWLALEEQAKEQSA